MTGLRSSRSPDSFVLHEPTGFVTVILPTVTPLEPVSRRRSQDRRGWEVFHAGRWIPEAEARAAGAYDRPLPTHTPSPVVKRQGQPDELAGHHRPDMGHFGVPRKPKETPVLPPLTPMPTTPKPVTWPPQPCATCGNEYIPTRGSMGRKPIYCSKACSGKAERERKRARRGLPPAPPILDPVVAPEVTTESADPLGLEPGEATPLAFEPFAAVLARDRAIAASDQQEPADPSAYIRTWAGPSLGPHVTVEPVPSDDWHRGYEEGYRASVGSVDEDRAETEYLRGWSMGALDVCLTEALEYPGTPSTVLRLIRRAIKSVGEL